MKNPIDVLLGAPGEPVRCNAAMHWFVPGRTVCMCGQTTRTINLPPRRPRKRSRKVP